MDKSIYIDKFNEKIIELFTDLCMCFSGINEFKKIKSGLILFSNMEPKGPERIFRKNVSEKFRTQILEKNDDFFLKEATFDIHSTREEYWKDFIEQLKVVWTSIDDNNRDTIWKYFQILIILSDKCKIA